MKLTANQFGMIKSIAFGHAYVGDSVIKLLERRPEYVNISNHATTAATRKVLESLVKKRLVEVRGDTVKLTELGQQSALDQLNNQ